MNEEKPPPVDTGQDEARDVTMRPADGHDAQPVRRDDMPSTSTKADDADDEGRSEARRKAHKSREQAKASVKKATMRSPTTTKRSATPQRAANKYARPTVTAPDTKPRTKAKGAAWRPATADGLRNSMSSGGNRGRSDLGTKTAVRPDEERWPDQYACARRKGDTRRDGDQREMTKQETEVLHILASRKMFLARLPGFTLETHTRKERDALELLHTTQLIYRLYAVLPVGFKLPEKRSKWYFCHALLQANGGSAELQERATTLIANAAVIQCVANSQIVELRYVRPEDRDAWADAKFAFGKSSIVFNATDDIARRERRGYNNAAMSLMYEVQLLGRGDLVAQEVSAVFEAVTTVPVLVTEHVDTCALASYGPHR